MIAGHAHHHICFFMSSPSLLFLFIFLLSATAPTPSTAQPVVVANATEIYTVLQQDLLGRHLFRLGVDDVKYALSFISTRLGSQMGFPWVANVDQTFVMNELTDALTQLPLYPASSFVAPVVVAGGGYGQPVPPAWRTVIEALKNYKLTSGTGHGCPEFTNLIYDRTIHQLECVPIEGISMTLACESESAPYTFSIVIEVVALVIIVAILITAAVGAFQTAKTVDRASLRLREETLHPQSTSENRPLHTARSDQEEDTL